MKADRQTLKTAVSCWPDRIETRRSVVWSVSSTKE